MSRERTNAELLYWAAGEIKREQDAGTFGSVTVLMEGGRIVRVKIERTVMPAFTNDGER